MRSSCRLLGVDLSQQSPALGNESPQYGIGQSGDPLLAETASCIDRRIGGGLRRVAGLLNLMRARDQQCTYLGRDSVWARQQHFDGRCQAQIPADRAQRDGADGGTLWAICKWHECRVYGPPFV